MILLVSACGCMLLLCSFLNIFSTNIFKMYSKYIMLFCVIMLFLLAGLREGTADQSMYIALFDASPDLFTQINNDEFSFFYNTREEIGYLFCNSLIKFFTDESEWLFLLISGIAMSLYYSSLKRYSVYPALTIMLYFSMTFMVKEMAQIRHGIAIAIFIYSIRYIISSELKKYTLCILVAMLFHKSIVLMFFVYFMRNLIINVYYIAFITFFGVCMAYLNILDNFLLNLMPDADFMKRILVYMNSIYLQESDNTRFIKYSILFYILFLFKDVLRSKYKLYDVMMIIFSYGLFLNAALVQYPFFADRFAAPAWGVIAYLLPSCIDISKNIIWKVIAFTGIIILSISIFYSNLALIAPI